MRFTLSRTSLWSLTAFFFACQQTGPTDDKSNDDAGTGGTMSAGATAGMPSSGAGMGTGGSDMSVGGSAGTPALGGTAGVPPSGAGMQGLSGDGGAGAPLGGTAGMAAAGDGGAPAAGMNAGGAGAGGAGTAGDTTAAGTGGTETTAGMGGMSGTAGAAATAHPCPDGCAELSVPCTAYKAGQYFEIYLAGATDMSAAVVSVKARKISGKAGGLLIVVKDGSAQSYAYAQGAWNAINDMTGDFKTFTLDVAAPSSTDTNNTFDPSAVQIITVQIAAGDPWYTDTEMTMEDPAALLNPTVVQIDEITVTGTGTLPGPYPFTTSADPLKASISDDALAATPPYAVANSTVTWVGP